MKIFLRSGSALSIVELDQTHLKKAFIVTLGVLFTLIASSSITASAQENTIPGWIKNNAGWWAEGQIDDVAFLQGIQFLIKEGILIIPLTETSEPAQSQEVPAWIKNNAGWWAEGQIDDNTFVSGIQFLIKVGIIGVEQEQTQPSEIEKEKRPEILKTGEFEGLFFHHAEGIAKIIKANDETVLQFENFEVTDGPDLRVYLTQNGDVNKGINLAKLIQSKGDQSYSLENIDIESYNTVLIYCQPFGIPFGQAKLM